jgi:PAS domain S-box-containing protein
VGFLGIASKVSKIRQAYYERSPDGIKVIRNGKFFHCNDKYLSMLGYDNVNELVGVGSEFFTPPTQPDGRSSREKSLEVIDEARQKGFCRFEWTHRRRDNSTFTSLVTLFPLVVDGETLIISVNTDISEVLANREKISSEMEDTIGNFSQSVSSLLTRSDEAVQRMNGSATEEARIFTHVNQNVQTVAAAASQLSGAIAEISGSVADAARISVAAAEEAERTDTTVAALAASADKIGEIVKLIKAIANQTNLLALNAAIEAARAGEAGKGFAVVANEVKSLAGQTAKATEEIIGQITSVQAETHSAVEAIRHIGGIIEQLRAISTNIASAVEEQGISTKEVSSHIAEVAQATNNASGIAAKTVESTSELSQDASALRDEVTAFLNKVGKLQNVAVQV